MKLYLRKSFLILQSHQNVLENANASVVILVQLLNVGTVVRRRLKLVIPTGVHNGPPGVNGVPAL